MALGSSNAEIFKKNAKFESFLKRTITEEAFERIRAYESCIVVSEKENKSFKFVVLSDEWIYLTENPPKTLQEVVHLKDVTSVELVNEFPDFLSGEERKNTQHIAISFMTSEPARRRSLRKSKRSPRSSLTDMNGADRSNSSTPLGYSSSADSGMDELMTSHNSPSLIQSRPTSRGSIKGLQTKKKKKTSGLNDSLDHESILRSLKEEIEEDMLEDIEEDRLSMVKSTVPFNSDQKFNKSTTASSQAFGKVAGLNGSDKKTSMALQDAVSIRSSSQQSVRPLPPMPRTGAFETMARRTSVNSLNQSKQLQGGHSHLQEVEKVQEKRCCFFFKCCGGQKNQVAPICKGTQTKSKAENLSSTKKSKFENLNVNNSFTGSHLSDSQGLGNPPPSRGSSVRGGSRTGTPLLESDRNINELNTSTSDLGRSASFIGLNSLPVDGLTEKRKCVLNVYLLNLTSPLLMLIRSAWNNYIIKSTLALEPEQIAISTTPVPLSVHHSETRWRDKVERQYTHLKRDLLQAHLSLEEQLPYIEQLKSEAQTNFLLKKLFWKNPDMLYFLICQLQKYLPHSEAQLNTDEGKAQRADELEFVTSILNTMNLMFRESEILPSRLQTLRLESGKNLVDFLCVLMCQPDIPYQPLTLTKHWSAPVSSTKMVKNEKNLDEELARLKTEYTRTAISSAFELFLVVKQAPPDEITVLSVPGMVNLFEEYKSTEKFVDRLLSQTMELVSLSRFDLLTPVQAMQVFEMFTLLQVFMEHNKRIVSHVRNNYYEEFKYFIQAPAVSRKLPVQYPITAITISIIDQVVAQVLGGQTSRTAKT